MHDQSAALPRRVTVSKVVSSRYASGLRPLSWDERKSGPDIVETSAGETLTLASDAQQSPPQTGWVLLLREQAAGASYSWTLYGLPKGAGVTALERDMCLSEKQ